MLFRELEGRTIYLILSKPIERYEFLIGKFLGLLGVILLLVAIETIALTIVMLFKDLSLDPLIYVAILSIVFKLTMMIAVILFFSTFTAPLIALCTSVGVYLIGHSGSELIAMGLRTNNHFVQYTGEFIKVFFPNMEALSLPKYALNSSIELSSAQVITSFGIASAYTLLLLLVASWIFNRKNFERF